MYPLVKVTNCTVTTYDYNDLIGKEVAVIQMNIEDSEWCLVKYNGDYRIVAEADLDEEGF